MLHRDACSSVTGVLRVWNPPIFGMNDVNKSVSFQFLYPKYKDSTIVQNVNYWPADSEKHRRKSTSFSYDVQVLKEGNCGFFSCSTNPINPHSGKSLNCYLFTTPEVHKFSKKSRSHLKILGLEVVKCCKFHSDDPQILQITV